MMDPGVYGRGDGAASRAFLGMSHTPLWGLNPIAADIEAELDRAVAQARDLVHNFAPDLIVLIGPDHYNGFFNELMPPFCIGTQAQAIGDYGTPAGDLNVPSKDALGLASHLMDHGFDAAVSRRMHIDHGFAQVLQFMWGSLDTPPVVPIFMNAVAQPGIPRLKRCLQIGQSIGAWLDTLSYRTLVIGSGGLSHEPPVPTLDHPDPRVRERITVRRVSTPDEAAAKTERVKAAGMALASGTSTMKPLAPAWDRAWMDALDSGDYGLVDALTEDGISGEAGLSAHESKTWLIARSALSDQAHSNMRFYRDIPELIAGYGILFMQDRNHRS